MAAAAPSELRVVICGGGIVGASCAYYLSLKGVRHITIVEKAGIACHASGKAAGFLARDWGGVFAQVSYDLHAELGSTLSGTGYRAVETLSVAMGGQGSSVRAVQLAAGLREARGTRGRRQVSAACKQAAPS